MEKKIYYLSTCSTCKRIMNEVDMTGFEQQDIKTEKMTEAQVNEMAKRAGGYEPLFSRTAMKYRAWGLNEKTLTEDDYKKYMLEEYTFLKRPVFLIDGKIFVCNSKKVIASVQEALAG